MKEITIRETSVRRPLFLTIDDGEDEIEYTIDGIDSEGGEYTVDDRWVIQDNLEEFERGPIKSHQGAWGEFYCTYVVPDNITIKDLLIEIVGDSDEQ